MAKNYFELLCEIPSPKLRGGFHIIVEAEMLKQHRENKAKSKKSIDFFHLMIGELEFPNLADMISHCFVWSETTQGKMFWCEVFEALSEGDFDYVEHLIKEWADSLQ